MPAKRCDLIIPGLLPSLHGLSAGQLQAGYPALQRFFSKAISAKDMPDYHSLLSNLFGYDSAQSDLPFAAFAAASLGADPDDGYWISACPVNLFPDRDCLLLKMPRQKLTAEQLQWLSELLLDQFADIVLEAHILEQRLLLRLREPQSLKTFSLIDALGKNVEPFLPAGPDKSRWHAIANEIQMMIFQQQDLSEVCNALWFEAAGGVLANTSDSHDLPDCLVADDRLLIATAQQLGVAAFENAADAIEKTAGDLLLVDLQLLKTSASAEHPEDWQSFLIRIERLMQLLLGSLKKGRITQISLHSLDGYRFDIRTADLYRFWRKRLLPGGRPMPAAGR